MEIIGLSGYAQTGKDTVAEILAEQGYERVAFADLLRQAVYALDPRMEFGDQTYAEVMDTWGYELARTTPHRDEIRRLLQRMGTEVGRNLFGEDFWVDQTMSRLDPKGSYVITDCRFLNEARAVVNRKGHVWRIVRPGVGPANDHISEVGLDDWPFDVTIVNDGTVEDLAVKVKRTLAEQ